MGNAFAFPDFPESSWYQLVASLIPAALFPDSEQESRCMIVVTVLLKGNASNSPYQLHILRHGVIRRNR
jgi:hypothetical protein